MWTQHEGSCPPQAVPARCKPLVAAGLRYEQRIFRALRQTDLEVRIQPWLCNSESCMGDDCHERLVQPDAVVLFPGAAVVIECKLNWKHLRDRKLKKVYLPAVQLAFGKPLVCPLMIVSCLRRYEHQASRNLLDGLKAALTWSPGAGAPVLLMP